MKRATTTSQLTPLPTLQAVRDDLNNVLHPPRLKDIPQDLMSDLYHALTCVSLSIVEAKSEAGRPSVRRVVYRK